MKPYGINRENLGDVDVVGCIENGRASAVGNIPGPGGKARACRTIRGGNKKARARRLIKRVARAEGKAAG